MQIQFLTVLVLVAASAFAEPVCPASVMVDESLRSDHPGWNSGRTETPHILAGMTIFEGKPADLASLIGDQRKPSKTTMISTWKFTPGTQYWISCTYASTGIVLAQPIPLSYRTCVVTYSTDVSIDGLPQIRKMEWR